ncbi:sigma 54-interacting transcriptional regulator, partial [Verrucomicrobiales bacterium]|nr:sigma 54-interacting transcriptional regulator [Verrucomicrobiales bacterium]
MSDAPEQTILVIDLDPDFLLWASKHLSVPGVNVVTESDPARAVTYFMEEKPDLVISEYALGNATGIDLLRGLRQQEPNAMVILTTGFPSTKAVIESMKLGAYDFLGKQSLVYDLRPVVENALKASEEMKSASPVGDESSPVDPDETIIGNSPAMQDVFKMIGRVSRSDAPVMITGESGCGKEVVAGAIHKFSPRSRGEFVAINCAAIPENLLESELFGHEKGSFSGASQRRAGRFE